MTGSKALVTSKISVRTFKSAQIFLGCAAHSVRLSVPAEAPHERLDHGRSEGLNSKNKPGQHVLTGFLRAKIIA